MEFWDVTALVLGAVVGADIYVGAALGARYLGPAALVAWATGALVAWGVALALARCAMLAPRVGGSYAYTREAFGPAAGFAAGWALWLAEWIALAVFPVALTRYLGVLYPGLTPAGEAVTRLVFVAFLTAVNYRGILAAGRFNDLLTLLKLGPLLALTLAGAAFLAFRPALLRERLIPFAPLGWAHFGAAFSAVFWAYAGFELAAIPAGQIREPGQTLSRAIHLGMVLVAALYLALNLTVLVLVPWREAAASPAPLSAAARALLENLSLAPAAWGAVLMAWGALLSISGAHESGMLGTAWLGYALAADGYFPRPLARLHPRFGTPYVALLVQNGLALAASLWGDFEGLVHFSVFYLALVYLVTGLAALHLSRKPLHQDTPADGALTGGAPPPPGLWERAAIWVGIAGSVYLLAALPWWQKAWGLAGLAAGVPFYLWLAPRKPLAPAQAVLTFYRARQLADLDAPQSPAEHFLGHLVKHAVRLGKKRITKVSRIRSETGPGAGGAAPREGHF